MEGSYNLGRMAFVYAFREPVCLWFNATVDNKAMKERGLNGYGPLGEEYAETVEKVSRAIGHDVGLTQEQMEKRGAAVLYPFDMTAMPEKRQKIQKALRDHLPKLRKYDPDIMGLLHQLEKARYVKEPSLNPA